jgi:type I restriction enzyme S subunit
VLLSMESGSRPKGGVRAIHNGVPSIGGEHLNSDGGFNFEEIRYVPEAFYKSMRRGHVSRGDVLVVKDGATTGKVSLVREDFPFERAVVNEHVFVCRPCSDISAKYLYWYLFSIPGQRGILEHFRGSAQGGITQSFADGTLIPLPSRPVQESISRYLDDIFARVTLIRSNLAAATLALRRFRDSILAAACSGDLTADWRAVHPASSAAELATNLSVLKAGLSRQRGKPTAKIAESSLPDIPQSWVWLSLDAVSRTVVDGVHKTPHYVASGVPFITVRNLTAGPRIDFRAVKYISEADHQVFTGRARPQRGDLLISKDGTLGVVRQIDTERDFSIFVSVAMVKPLLYEMTDFLEIALSSPQVQNQMVGVGSGLLHLVLRDLKGDGIPVPPLEEQREIISRVRALMQHADSIGARLARLSAQVERTSQAVVAQAFHASDTDSAG